MFRDQSWRWRAPKPLVFRLDAPLEHEGCAFCAALNEAISGDPGHSFNLDLLALELEHGECTCLAGL